MADLVWTENVAYLNGLPDNSIVINRQHLAYQVTGDLWYSPGDEVPWVGAAAMVAYVGPVAVVWVPDDRR